MKLTDNEPLTTADLELLPGRTSVFQTELYVRVPRFAGGAGVTLRGALTGPVSEYGQTLPLHAPLRDLGRGNSLLAKALVTDPSFWTPRSPARYQLQLEVVAEGKTLQSAEFEYGFRAFATQAEDVLLEQERFVFRGITVKRADRAILEQCRSLSATVCVDEPDETICGDATRLGVPLIACCGWTDNWQALLRRLNAHAAVSAVQLPRAAPIGDTERAAAGGLLLGTRLPDRRTPIPPWAQFLETGVTDLAGPSAGSSQLPTLVRDESSTARTPEEQRAACDRLQARVASQGCFAGYLIGGPGAHLLGEGDDR